MGRQYYLLDEIRICALLGRQLIQFFFGEKLGFPYKFILE